eukprot:TRINITY_DN27263_c0_g1_i1.p1 TRINITY_DN27263_c0_g1~~TRINITY_DN27263_c0_g1_i1.p1  ORF type:complete len:185 (-),score=33.56 TRINITY_DN27263_c0_g1_i1:59-613(-)
MFRKFTRDEHVTGFTLAKSSVTRGLKSKLIDQFPSIEKEISDLLPKKEAVYLAKAANHLTFIVVGGEPYFFQIRDGPFIPTLKVLHRHPNILPRVQVDEGAIRFVLAGANIMCVGMTSPGGRLPEENLPAETIVAVYAEGKQNAVAVGSLQLSTDEIKSINKDIGVNAVHHLGDALWKNTEKWA